MTTATQSTTALPADDQITRRPTGQEAIVAIEQATGCTTREAQAFLDYFIVLVTNSRQLGYRAYYPTDEELGGRNYQTLEELFPHGEAVATPGSPRAVVERHVLDPADGEIGVIHYMDDEPGSPRDCAVQVCCRVARL